MIRTNFDLENVYRKLETSGVSIDPKSIKKNLLQGAGSEVFVADSTIGKIVIHTGYITKEIRRQKTWGKIMLAGKLLEKASSIPSSSVLFSGIHRERYYIVQTMLPGHSPGKRIEKKKVLDIWNIWSTSLEKSIERTIAQIHQIPVQGGGWITSRNGAAVGKYTSWEEFLEHEIPLWLRSIQKKEKNSILTKRLKQYYEKNRNRFSVKKSVLVHGDLTSPSNMLVKDNKVTGIIDWEFALAGDPAWEFCFNNRYSLKTYFSCSNPKLNRMQRKDFSERTKLYEPLFLAWVLSLLAKDDPAYAAYRKRLKELGG